MGYPTHNKPHLVTINIALQRHVTPRNPIKSAPPLLALILGSAAYLSPIALQAQTETPTPPAAQTPAPVAAPAPPKPAVPRNIIFLDPAHGGPDTGAHL